MIRPRAQNKSTSLFSGRIFNKDELSILFEVSFVKKSQNLERLAMLVERMSSVDANEEALHNTFNEVAMCSPLPIAIWKLGQDGSTEMTSGTDIIDFGSDEMITAHELALSGKQADFVVRHGNKVIHVRIVPHLEGGEQRGATGIALDVTPVLRGRSPQLERSSA